MRLLQNLLVVFGFCLATLGAAGFAREIEAWAIPMFAGGFVFLAAGAWMNKSSKSSGEGAASLDTDKAQVSQQIDKIRDIVAGIDDGKANLESDEIRRRIDELLKNEYFDLTSRNDEIAKLLGFTNYARVWEHVAIAERLLARVWSIATDGYLETALQDLPEARRQIERAATEMAAI
jgi:hypothetical protein